jgi:hypothetical protein
MFPSGFDQTTESIQFFPNRFHLDAVARPQRLSALVSR